MTKEEILARVPIKEVLAEYGIKINRQDMCSCPWHGKDKNPSMKIYAKTNTYNCFTCGANGDVFSLVQNMENCSFKDAFLKLGGTYEQMDSKARELAKRSREKARLERERQEKAERDMKRELYRAITIARLGTKIFVPLTEDWILCTNALQKFLYYSDNLEEGGVNKLDVYRKCRKFRQFFGIKLGAF